MVCGLHVDTQFSNNPLHFDNVSLGIGWNRTEMARDSRLDRVRGSDALSLGPIRRTKKFGGVTCRCIMYQ